MILLGLSTYEMTVLATDETRRKLVIGVADYVHAWLKKNEMAMREIQERLKMDIQTELMNEAMGSLFDGNDQFEHSTIIVDDRKDPYEPNTASGSDDDAMEQ